MMPSGTRYGCMRRNLHEELICSSYSESIGMLTAHRVHDLIPAVATGRSSAQPDGPEGLTEPRLSSHLSYQPQFLTRLKLGYRGGQGWRHHFGGNNLSTVSHEEALKPACTLD